jgi:hypothetical protein
VNLVNDEGIRDTLIDLHNYAAMALMLIDEWNGIASSEKDLKINTGSYLGMSTVMCLYFARVTLF